MSKLITVSTMSSELKKIGYIPIIITEYKDEAFYAIGVNKEKKSVVVEKYNDDTYSIEKFNSATEAVMYVCKKYNEDVKSKTKVVYISEGTY